MNNCFEEKKKDIDMSTIDSDAQIFQRKKLELDDKYSKRIDSETEFYTKERELANNNDDELIRRTKVAAIDNDFKKTMTHINEEYQKELKKLEDNSKNKYPENLQYFKWFYMGPVRKYIFPNGKIIHSVMSYYVKLNNNRLSVYNDSKFSDLLGEIDYIHDEWKESTIIE